MSSSPVRGLPKSPSARSRRGAASSSLRDEYVAELENRVTVLKQENELLGRALLSLRLRHQQHTEPDLPASKRDVLLSPLAPSSFASPSTTHHRANVTQDATAEENEVGLLVSCTSPAISSRPQVCVL